MSRFGSPALDILHHIFTSTDQDLRQSDYQNLLRHYHASLSTIVAKLGSDPLKLFTFDDLQRELKRFGAFGFLIGPMMQQMVMAEPNAVRDMTEYANDMENKTGDANFIGEMSAEREQKYVRRVNGILEDLVRFGYYWN